MNNTIIIPKMIDTQRYLPGTALVGAADLLLDGRYLSTENYNLHTDSLNYINEDIQKIPYSLSKVDGFSYGLDEGSKQLLCDVKHKPNTFNYDGSSQLVNTKVFDSKNYATIHYLKNLNSICTFSHKYNRYLSGRFSTEEPIIYVNYANSILIYVNSINELKFINMTTLTEEVSYQLLENGHDLLYVLEYDETKIKYISYQVYAQEVVYKIFEIDLTNPIIEKVEINSSTFKSLSVDFDVSGMFSNKVKLNGNDYFAIPTSNSNSRGVALVMLTQSDELITLTDDAYFSDFGGTGFTLRICEGHIICIPHATSELLYMTFKLINDTAVQFSEIVRNNDNDLPLNNFNTYFFATYDGKFTVFFDSTNKIAVIASFNSILGKYVELNTLLNCSSLFLDRDKNKIIYRNNSDDSIRIIELSKVLAQIKIKHDYSKVYLGYDIKTEIEMYVMSFGELIEAPVRLRINGDAKFTSNNSKVIELLSSEVQTKKLEILVQSDKDVEIYSEFME